MSDYKAIDEYVQCYQTGQKSPKGSPERERGKNAAEMLLMTFKPLILSTMQRTPGITPSCYEDACQDGCLAFLEGIMKFDPGHGAAFNAFIKSHLQLYYRKWQCGQFNRSVTAEKQLSEPERGCEGLSLEEVITDETVDLEERYIESESRQRLWQSVEALSARQGRVVYQLFHERKSLVQIAEEMGVTHKAVRNLRDKGLKNLKKSLKGVPF